MQDLAELNGEVKPIAALIAYKSGTDTYFESHSIVEGKMGPGKPASVESLGKIKLLFESVDAKVYQTIKGAIPRNLLYINSDKTNPVLVFHTTSQKVKLNFSKSLKVASQEYYVPKLLWVFKGGEISIYALRTATLTSKVYQAPFFNIYQNGNVCMGNVSMEKEFSDISEAMEKIQGYFYNSQFTTHGDYDHRIKGSLVHFWRELGESNKGQIWSNNHLFVQDKQFKTIQDVIDQFN